MTDILAESYYVYLLESTKKSTYIGATIDLNRRLRQHNKEIQGGAKYTGSRVSKGETWKRIAYVSGFPTWQAALQFEWRWKQLSRKKHLQYKTPMNRRFLALNHLLSLEKSTEKAVPYSLWKTPIQIHLEDTDLFLSFLI